MAQLGLKLREQGIIKTAAPFSETSVKGVLAVEDCTFMFPAMVNAMSMGVFIAGVLVGQMQSARVAIQHTAAHPTENGNMGSHGE